MPSFVTARVMAITDERAGLQRVQVQLSNSIDEASQIAEPAYVLTELTGPVQVGDDVIINTTAVELQLGTGGNHVVHWNMSRTQQSQAGRGHVMKLRYTSLQCDTGVESETHDDPSHDSQYEIAQAHKPLDKPQAMERQTVNVQAVTCLLHSQVGVVASTWKALTQGCGDVAYIMTDQACLPIAISDMCADLKDKGLVQYSITSGQAFGGDLEAVNVADAMELALRRGAGLILIGPGPGVVGTGTKYGFGELEIAHVMEDVQRAGVKPIFALRYSGVDARARHRGVSHHSLTVLEHTFASGLIGIPIDAPDTDVLKALSNHVLVPVEVPEVSATLERAGIEIETMGRSYYQDPYCFRFTAAAGALAAQRYLASS